MEAKAEMSAIEMEKATSDGEVVLGGAGNEEEEEDVVLPGYRFHPTDEELVTFYLRRKVARKSLSIEVIREMDIYKHDPWDLPKASTVGGEKEWYFFCLRGRKYRNSIRPNRVTGSGFWKATGIDRPIYSAAAGGSGSGVSIGLKKSLVYYRGSAGKGTKTDWMMHEFRLPPAPAAAATNSSPSMQEAEVWTICRIFRRAITYRKQQQPQQTWRPAPAPSTAAHSSSNTGSFESSEGGDEYMNCLQAPAAAAPCIPQHQHQHQHQQQQQYVSQTGTVDSGNFFYMDTMYNQQFQGQWNAPPATSVPEQKPQNPLSTADSFHQNDHSLAVAANDFYKVEALEGHLEEIARMMEVTDPAGLYDYRSYGSSAGNRGPSFVRTLHSSAP